MNAMNAGLYDAAAIISVLNLLDQQIFSAEQRLLEALDALERVDSCPELMLASGAPGSWERAVSAIADIKGQLTALRTTKQTLADI